MVFNIFNINTNKIILDSSVFIFYFGGQYYPNLINKRGRLQGITNDEFKLLYDFVTNFEKKYVCASILTEFYSLFKKDIDDKLNNLLSNKLFLNQIIENEFTIITKEITDKSHFPKLGFTDSYILEYAKYNDCLVFTKDRTLYNICLYNSVNSIHFDDFRRQIW